MMKNKIKDEWQKTLKEMDDAKKEFNISNIFIFKENQELAKEDTWESGVPLDTIVFGLCSPQPKIAFNLPNGERLFTTLIEYNKCFPFIFSNEDKWRNAANAQKRKKIGWTEKDKLADEELKEAWNKWKKNISEQSQDFN